MRRVALALLGGAAVLLAPISALAQPPAAALGTYSVPQPGGGTIQNCAVQVGALPSTVFHPCHVIETVDGGGLPHPVGPSNALPVANGQEHTDLAALATLLATPLLPPGGATSALQVSNAAQAHADTLSVLQALATLLQPGGGVAVTSSALPTGAATSAGQTSAQTSLTAIAASTAAGATAAGQTTAHTDATAALTQQTATATNTAAISTNTAAGATSANQTTELTRLGSIATNTASPAYPPSGVTAVSTAITAAGASGSVTPAAGRTFHAQLTGTGVATCYLERKLDGTNWVPITATAAGTTTTLYNWSYTGSALSEDVVEAQYGVPYRVDCGAQLGSYTSGTINAGLTQ